MNSKEIDETLEAVRRAQEEVTESLANATPEKFQEADKQLMLAQQLVNDVQKHSESATEEQKSQIHHAKEHMKHLQEAQNSLR